MNELVTVIVPVYKVEKYLYKCVDSILAQTYTNLEIILVNDGSPDNCGDICDEYVLKDSRIKVIHKENGGLSSARNAAIDVMSGDFVTFIDSDDYVDSHYVEKLYNALKDNNADISICAEEYILETINSDLKSIGRPFEFFSGLKVMTCEQAIIYCLQQELFEAAAWAKLYKSSLFDEVRYPEGYAYEDQGTTYKTFLKSNIIVFISDRLYFYLQRGGSILHSNTNSKKYWDGMEMIERQCSEICEIFPNIKNIACIRKIAMYFHVFIGAIQVNDPKLMELCWERLIALRNIEIVFAAKRRKIKFAVVLSYLGKWVNTFIYWFYIRSK